MATEMNIERLLERTALMYYNRTDQGQGARALHTYSRIIISHCDLL